MSFPRNFYTSEIYHVYSRGIDKRITFESFSDRLRFLDSLYYFNQVEPIESIYEYTMKDPSGESRDNPLVEIIAYNILDNHFHLLLRQLEDDGVSKFMNRVLAGYVRYYNEKNSRSGQLFAKPFKSQHVSSDGYYKYVLAYITFNHKVHSIKKFGADGSKQCSYQEITDGISLNGKVICTPDPEQLADNYEISAELLLQKTIKERAENKNKRLKSPLAKALIE